MKRCRVTRPVTFVGVGVHTGDRCRVTLQPGGFGQGWVIVKGQERVSLGPTSTFGQPGSSAVRVGDQVVRTFEHWLAAMHILGVTDGEIIVEGPEWPILDGSAGPYVAAVADLRQWHGSVQPCCPAVPVQVSAFGGHATWSPATDLKISATIDFGPKRTGQAIWTGALDLELVRAKTFVCEHDVAAALAQGLGRGASKENTVVWKEDGAGVRPSDAARHKLLDAMGDVYVVGPVCGHIHVDRGSHRLHHALVRAACDVGLIHPAQN